MNAQKPSARFDTQWRVGFDFVEPVQVVEHKLDQIFADGPDSLAIVLDWDGVITIKDSEGVNGTSWGILTGRMTEAGRQRHAQLYSLHRPMEKAGTLSVQQAAYWQTEALLQTGGIALNDLREDARKHIYLRRGVIELSALCTKLGIPFIIKSAGEQHIIEAVVEKHSLNVTHIFANRLHIFQKTGLVTARTINNALTVVEPGTLTTPLNKDSFSHHSVIKGPYRPNVIVVGDNKHDKYMVNTSDASTILRVFLDGGRQSTIKHEGPDAWQNILSQEASSNPGFDMLAIYPNMVALNNLLKALCTPRLS